ncbi:MAG: hypothetical protein QXZ09_03045 [Candidatus Methanomethylicaceae archaeon]
MQVVFKVNHFLESAAIGKKKANFLMVRTLYDKNFTRSKTLEKRCFKFESEEVAPSSLTYYPRLKEYRVVGKRVVGERVYALVVSEGAYRTLLM